MAERSQLIEQVADTSLLQDDTFRIVLLDEGSENVRAQYETKVKLNDPFAFDVSAFLPNEKALTLPRFFDIAAKIIEDAQLRSGIVESKRVKLVEEYPPDKFEDYGDEVIAFRVLSRKPANMNRNATSRPQRGSGFAYNLINEYYPNKVLVVESRPLDHMIEFSCWAKSNKLANRRALWLEKLFVNYGTWVFETQGADRFYFDNRGPDTYMTTGQQRLFYRPVNFFLRIREFEVKAHPQIKQIEVQTSLI